MPWACPPRLGQAAYRALRRGSRPASSPVDRIHDAERAEGIVEAAGYGATRSHGPGEIGPFQLPGQVRAWILMDHGIGRTHRRPHLVVVEPLHAVAPAQSFEMQLGVARVDLEGKQVLPLGAGSMQVRHLARSGTEE